MALKVTRYMLINGDMYEERRGRWCLWRSIAPFLVEKKITSNNSASQPCLGCQWEHKRGGPCSRCSRAPLPLKKDMYAVAAAQQA